jgi:hypothetical protein
MAGPAQAALTVRALWNMNSLPTMVDSAGGDNNGTTVNVRQSGGAYSFDGATSYATAPDAANLNPGTTSIKLSARISITQVPATGQTFDIVRKGLTTTTGGYYKMEISRSSTGLAVVHCRFKDANKKVGEVVSSAGVANRGFVTVACTKTAAKVTVTVAGTSKAKSATLGSIGNTSAVFIGGKGDGTDWFPGLMDWVKIEIG